MRIRKTLCKTKYLDSAAVAYSFGYPRPSKKCKQAEININW